ncbi:MAG: hypothetical protein F4Y94_04155 [Chloroflexi bacterium]|nr:hypothetical protein [Chloroflexota bacterium]
MAQTWHVTPPGYDEPIEIEAPDAWKAACQVADRLPQLRGRLIRTEPNKHRAGVSWPLTGPAPGGKAQRLHVRRAPRGPKAP